jgi:hypothetical protein
MFDIAPWILMKNQLCGALPNETLDWVINSSISVYDAKIKFCICGMI